MTDRRTNLIPRDAILDLGDYERQRDDIRRGAIAARAARRVALGPNATIAFENRETVAYQIQEMLRAERIAKDAEVQHEIETYSDLLPSRDELSATLMFEFPEAVGRDVRLAELVGFEDHLWIDVAGSKAPAFFDRRQLDADRISAVQFIRFPIDDAQRDALARGEGVRIVSDHPAYAYSVEVPPHTCRALVEDLADG